MTKLGWQSNRMEETWGLDWHCGKGWPKGWPTSGLAWLLCKSEIQTNNHYPLYLGTYLLYLLRLYSTLLMHLDPFLYFVCLTLQTSSLLGTPDILLWGFFLIKIVKFGFCCLPTVTWLRVLLASSESSAAIIVVLCWLFLAYYYQTLSFLVGDLCLLNMSLINM